MSAFNKWKPGITYTEMIFLIDKHNKMELELMQENIDKSQIQIIDGKIICYKRKKIKIIQ